MKIAIAGGTGFVGKALTEKLIGDGHDVYILTRSASNKTSSPQLHFVEWLDKDRFPEKELEGIDALVNLAGESINSGRWDKERKESILNSRLSATEECNRIIKALVHKPRVLINASAVGIYGTSLSKVFTEDEKRFGTDFLAKTVAAWEAKAQEAAEAGVRVVLCRFGIILEKNDGALPRIALPYQFFAGGTVGCGEQWVSWIHLDDVVKGIVFAIEHNEIEGPVNFTSPHPLRMKEFGHEVGRALNRPHWLPAPAFAIKAALGEMSMLVLEGQKVLPVRLQEHQFHFAYPNLQPALENIFS